MIRLILLSSKEVGCNVIVLRFLPSVTLRFVLFPDLINGVNALKKHLTIVIFSQLLKCLRYHFSKFNHQPRILMKRYTQVKRHFHFLIVRLI